MEVQNVPSIPILQLVNHKGFKRKLDDSTGITKEVLLSTHTQCQFFMPHKRRFCGVAKVANSCFCGAHGSEIDDQNATKRERIPCPVDPSHSIYKDKEEVHVKICNAAKQRRQMESEPYFCYNCNSGNSGVAENTSDRTALSNDIISTNPIDPDVLYSKILSLYASLGDQIKVPPKAASSTELQAAQERFIEETVLKAVAAGQSSFKQVRHAKQDSQIVLEMLRGNLLSLTSSGSLSTDLSATSCSSHSATEGEDKRMRYSASNTVYVELGAGRGVLGQSVSSVSPSSRLVLVERSGQRRKADTQMRWSEGTQYGQFTRLKMDIRHIRLSGLPGLYDHSAGTGTVAPKMASSSSATEKRLVVIAKHLCGVATDLALHSLKALPDGAAKGMSIATCCHHACIFDDYCGREWLSEQGISRDEFNLLKFWSGWAFALGSTRPAASDAAGPGEAEDDEHGAQTQQNTCPRPKNISREEMAACGAKIKRILDFGRLLYAQQQLGITDCRVVQYCEPHESPECFLLLGQSV